MAKVKKLIEGPVDWFLYTVMGEKQRKFVSNAISDKQKELLKHLLLGKKEKQRQQLKQIKYHLYNLGFIEQGLGELNNYMDNIKSPYFKRLAAWELTLWHANQYNADDARKALNYIEISENGETDSDQLRRMAIIKAELLGTCGDSQQGKEVIHQMLQKESHPDLYLAMANLYEELHERFDWINKAFEMFDLNKIDIDYNADNPYDSLTTVGNIDNKTDGPLVSVIIPAYNAEEGIKVAIDSILAQSWKNIELLVVDDCSPDETLKVIQSYEEKDNRVKVFQTPKNSGPYVARNIALTHAKGEYVTINDSDDWSHALKIETQVNHLINNKHVIANTSGHARITEELKLYRRGTPGKYIFPNMSSIMFRREPVIEKIGYWDSVRFAADGEFKRRLLKQFGNSAYIDLNSGPLSLPRQSVTSLTGSSAFGYNGFFMGVRKEYVESLEYHHKYADHLRYPYPMEERPFPVPEPMWPEREAKQAGQRQFDFVVAADYRQLNEEEMELLEQVLTANPHKKVGLVQVFHYDLTAGKQIDERVRNKVDGKNIHFLVYGEKIKSDNMMIIDPTIFWVAQKYLPEITVNQLQVIITHSVTENSNGIDTTKANITNYLHIDGIWYTLNEEVRQSLKVTENDSFGRVWDKGCISDD